MWSARCGSVRDPVVLGSKAVTYEARVLGRARVQPPMVKAPSGFDAPVGIAAVLCRELETLVPWLSRAALLIENVEVEESILAGLDVYASSHPHLKAITGTRGSVLSKRLIHVGDGWRGEVVGVGLEGEANPHEGEARSSSRNYFRVAGDDVSAISAQRPRLMCRNCSRAATLSLLTRSLLSQLLSDEERRQWLF